MVELAFHTSPRCGAKTKNHNGRPCRSPAVKGKKRCRIHGGGKGSGGQKKNKNAFKHGFTTALMKSLKKELKQTLKNSLETLNRNN